MDPQVTSAKDIDDEISRRLGIVDSLGAVGAASGVDDDNDDDAGDEPGEADMGDGDNEHGAGGINRNARGLDDAADASFIPPISLA